MSGAFPALLQRGGTQQRLMEITASSISVPTSPETLATAVSFQLSSFDLATSNSNKQQLSIG